MTGLSRLSRIGRFRFPLSLRVTCLGGGTSSLKDLCFPQDPNSVQGQTDRERCYHLVPGKN